MADIIQAKIYVNMTDLNTPLSRGRKTAGNKRAGARADGTVVANTDIMSVSTEAMPEADLHAFAELLFFAYRDFTGDPDAILKDFGFNGIAGQ